MVKRIKIIDEIETPPVDIHDEIQNKLMEYMKAIDWKLWELLKIETARAEKEGLVIHDPIQLNSNTSIVGSTVKQIIIDDVE